MLFETSENIDQRECCCYMFVRADSTTLVFYPLFNFILFQFMFVYFQITKSQNIGTRLK